MNFNSTRSSLSLQMARPKLTPTSIIPRFFSRISARLFPASELAPAPAATGNNLFIQKRLNLRMSPNSDRAFGCVGPLGGMPDFEEDLERAAGIEPASEAWKASV